ncbi:hypothetical protein [Argonema antarcticum]|uniref:hypothetical protein n=1 Tax=Argonema antarcticum TaxID=2942763 RepID=UPI002012A116|nr:hypothetical protein [Argonema antarcticum]MCL1471031.1 hypothetical protein [Argonema antarcticum A004/B2]
MNKLRTVEQAIVPTHAHTHTVALLPKQYSLSPFPHSLPHSLRFGTWELTWVQQGFPLPC